MPAYWIARAKVTDAEAFRRYGEMVASIRDKFDYEVLARGGPYRLLEGPNAFDRFVLLRFPSVEDALTYYHSPEYQAAIAIRREAGEAEIVVAEGLTSK